jgi:DNA-binding NarL/FixJ family response regulator
MELSPKDWKVYSLLFLMNKEIAKRLGISKRSVEKSVFNICKFFNVETRTAAMLNGWNKGYAPDLKLFNELYSDI